VCCACSGKIWAASHGFNGRLRQSLGLTNACLLAQARRHQQANSSRTTGFGGGFRHLTVLLGLKGNLGLLHHGSVVDTGSFRSAVYSVWCSLSKLSIKSRWDIQLRWSSPPTQDAGRRTLDKAGEGCLVSIAIVEATSEGAESQQLWSGGGEGGGWLRELVASATSPSPGRMSRQIQAAPAAAAAAYIQGVDVEKGAGCAGGGSRHG
jgi:hypothetical protein